MTTLYFGLFTIGISSLLLSEHKGLYDWHIPAKTGIIGNDSSFIEKVGSISFQMNYVSGGRFEMGSDWTYDQKPIHSVQVSSFYIMETEVTQALWEELMGNNPSYFELCPQCPVETVSWDDVQNFIRILRQKTGKNYRLPTEAEWEFAARGGTKSKLYAHSGSNNALEVSWFSTNSNESPHKVKLKKPNELGLYDMSGNVAEWCADWYGDEYYADSEEVNPQGPSSGTARVVRGGSWFYQSNPTRVASRFYTKPDAKGRDLGFRLVLTK